MVTETGLNAVAICHIHRDRLDLIKKTPLLQAVLLNTASADTPERKRHTGRLPSICDSGFRLYYG
jgi:hypothetical protein